MMDLPQLLILQIIAYILTDFTLQIDENSRDKNKLGFRRAYLKWHILIAFILSWVLSFQLQFVFAAILIALIHGIVDGFKKHLNNSRRLWKYSFFLDQLTHIGLVITIVLLFDRYFDLDPIFDFSIETKTLAIIAGFLFCSKLSNLLIGEILTLYKIELPEKNDLPNAGKLIGIIERFLVITFILLNQFEAVGFLLAAKSILRYKNDDPHKTEYVLIGTMLSFGIAIATGIILNQF